MMIRKNNYIILFILSFIFCQDYSLMNIYWNPEYPNKNESVVIYADVSEADYFKYSYQMNIHLSLDGKNYSTYPMYRDYNEGLFVWKYEYILDQNIHFQIDNNSTFNNISINSIELVDNSDTFKKIDLLLAEKKYEECIGELKHIINSNLGTPNAAKAEYMIAEIFLNDFEKYAIAANFYETIISSYPSHYDEVKKSMFTLAYIYANYLDYYTDAILIYNEFKNKYPNDDLISSIDYELQNLTKIEKEIKALLNSSK